MKYIKATSIIVVSGIIGTITNAIAASLIVAPGKISLAFVPGRYAVAILVAFLILPIYKYCGAKTFGILISIFTLTIAASLIAKLYFHAGAPWHLVFGLNFFYALATTATFGLLSKWFLRNKLTSWP